MFKFNLSTYLEKFKNLKDPKDDKTLISKAIQEVADIIIKEEDITLERETLFVRGNSLTKNRIFLMKDAILLKSNEFLVDIKIREIR